MATKQDKQARREQDGGMRCDSKRWYSVFCVAIESCRAHDAEPSAALRPAAYTARRFLEADVPPRPRLCACSLQNPHCAKLSLFPSLNSSLKQSQSKLPHRKGAPALFLLLLALGESPRTRHGFFSWYAETRRHRCKHTCGLHACPFLFAALEMVPVAVCTLHVRCWSSCWSLARSPRLQRG